MTLFVSRTHARLERRRQAVDVQDLGSSAGTFVNRACRHRAARVRHGDLVLNWWTPSCGSPRPRSGPRRLGWRRWTTAPGGTAVPMSPVNYDIGYQRDGVFHNVGRDQYQYVMQQ